MGPSVGWDRRSGRIIRGFWQHHPHLTSPIEGEGFESEKPSPLMGEGWVGVMLSPNRSLVLELGAVIAGPFAGSLMAELGGTVIKIETPGAGDSLRKMGPTMEGLPLWFGASAREKNCVTINLKAPEGKAMFERLIAQADVLVENFRPGVLERLGLGWDALRKINPSLVMLSISGFGQTGPQMTRPGFGKIAEGLSGVVNLTGPGGQSPLFVGFSLADASAGLFGVFGVAAALYQRDVLGGDGARIDLALYEPLMRMLDCQLALHAQTGFPPERSGGNDPYSFGVSCPGRPRFRSLGSRSGDWYLVALPDSEAADRLAGAIGTTSLEAWGAERTNAEIETTLAELAIDFTPIFDGMTIARSPYFQARGDVIATDHPALGRISAAGRLDGSRGGPAFRAPALGEDNAAVFGRLLGMDAAERERLADAGGDLADQVQHQLAPMRPGAMLIQIDRLPGTQCQSAVHHGNR